MSWPMDNSRKVNTNPMKTNNYKHSDNKEISKPYQALIFISTWVMVVFIGKAIFHGPKGDLDFVIKNFLSFAISQVIAGVILLYIPRKFLIPIVIIMWGVTFLTIF